MSTTQLQLKIVTPEKIIFEGPIDQVTLPTMDGEITVLKGHEALMSVLASGELVAVHDGEHIPFALVGGFLEVKDNVVVILADFAEHVGDITEDVVAHAQARAIELRTMKENTSIVDFEHFEAELERSLTRTKIADKWKKRKYR